jgi:hypothetical protein
MALSRGDELESVAALQDVVDGGEPAVDAWAEEAVLGLKATAAETGVVGLQVLALDAHAPVVAEGAVAQGEPVDEQAGALAGDAAALEQVEAERSALDFTLGVAIDRHSASSISCSITLTALTMGCRGANCCSQSGRHSLPLCALRHALSWAQSTQKLTVRSKTANDPFLGVAPLRNKAALSRPCF